MSADERRRDRKRGDTFYFLFQTLPVIVVLTVLTVVAIVYGLVTLVL